jgi:hypothetical protein
MRLALSWKSQCRGLAVALALAAGPIATAAPFELTPVEAEQVAARKVVIRASLDASERRGTVRAAVRIEAPPEVVFDMMIRCHDALEYVPKLERCVVRDQAVDESWLLVEHELDFGWYVPSVNWTFRADLEQDRRIRFHQVRGDFKANEGLWELEPTDDGATTLLLYQAFVDPPGFVPNWLARTTYRRELPRMLLNLRQRCEAQQTKRSGAGTTPR